jgi:hypothetical protein
MIYKIGASKKCRYKGNIASSKHGGRLLDYQENEKGRIKRMQRS